MIGGGKVAERKVGALLKAGAHIKVVSPAWTPRLKKWRSQKKITGVRRRYREGDLDGALLAFIATDDPRINRAVCEAAGRKGVWVNAAEHPAAGQFILPALLTRGDLTIAVSTGGKSPVLAKKIRADLKEVLKTAWGLEQLFLIALSAKIKGALSKKGVAPRRRREILAALSRSDIGSLFRKGFSDQGWEQIMKISGLQKEEVGGMPHLKGGAE